MNKKSFLENLEVFVSTETIKREVYKGAQTGKYRKLASRLYTTNFLDSAETITKRNLWFIVGQFFPGGLLTDRTALENRPSEEGIIYLISKRTRSIRLPGQLMIKSRKGHPPLQSDKPFIGGLHLPSLARAFLENMRVSRRSHDQLSPTLSIQDIEERLEQFLQRGSEKELNQLRDQLRDVAQKIDLQKEYKKIDALIGSILGTRTTNLESSLGKARRLGLPYDKTRFERFQNLYTYLKTLAPQSRLSRIHTEKGWLILSFFEAYFSNFIEGTEFALSEAEEIIFKGKIPIDRPQDAHDIIGTYQIVSSKQEMTKIPTHFENFIEILKKRHATLMSGRPDKDPGFFKKHVNRAGLTYFVDPNLVEGTLKVGFDLYKTLDVPFHRAVFMKFLISEVHPFNDGNGRLARIMMNAELVAENEEKILIPTVYRGNYLSALSALTHHNVPEPLIRVLDFAQKYILSIDWEDLQKAQKTLELTNAFLDSNQAEAQGIKLKLPD